jgi:hypothetical protein
MSDTLIWRYISLAKYIDLLRTKSLYFPKASLFKDDTEGKWWGHALLYEQAQPWRAAPANIKILEGILARAGQDSLGLLMEIGKQFDSSNEWVRNILTSAYLAQTRKGKAENISSL